jgi:hypothetical protein
MKTDNELISDFIGIKEVTQYFDSYGIKTPIYWTQTIDGRYRTRTYDLPDLSIKEFVSESKYSTSWDWLMPVVEQLSEPVVKNGILIRSAVDIRIYYKACDIKFEPDEDFEDLEDAHFHTQGETKLEAVYKAVVEFIKWYNQQSVTTADKAE